MSFRSKSILPLALALLPIVPSFAGNRADKSLSPAAEASKAAFMALVRMKSDSAEARKQALELPGTAEYLSSPEGMTGFYALANSLKNSPEGANDSLRRYAEMLSKIDHLRGWDGYQTVYLARAARETGDPALAERVRSESARLIKRTIDRHDIDPPMMGDASVVKYFGLDLAHLNGNAIRGALVDRPAPALKFVWSSEPGVRSLADLKGKIVVLDFWATWCKPCVGLFPKIREISASYAGKPVVFVGVTSLQGFSMDPEAGKVDCKGDPKKETSLMPGLMKKLGVTWTVAFSEKDCFNPDFDIMEIPHMAVVDAKGVVRYDGVEPDDLKERIDGLLAKDARGVK